MARTMKRLILTSGALLLMTQLAHAHTGVGQASGFMHGFSHPFSGLDHILAMVAVGLFAAQRGGRALWLVPLTFVAMMAVGGALGVYGVALPMVELGIAASVIVLGAAVAMQANLPVAAANSARDFPAFLHADFPVASRHNRHIGLAIWAVAKDCPEHKQCRSQKAHAKRDWWTSHRWQYGDG